ncbi:hypothetical protein ACOYR4_13175 [Acidovorax sp. M14]|uniref:hypothetical protein n=1 Tax=Acidovorax sp. M14 TaxID=3411354 RepID=UPI003BF55631
MTNQQGAEALAHELYTAAQLAPGEGVLDAVARLAALVEAQQTATHVQNPADIEHVAGDVSKNGAESNMAQQPAPSAAAAPVAVKAMGYGGSTGINDYLMSDGTVKAMRPAEVKWTPQPSPTPQADSQPAPATQQTGESVAIQWLAEMIMSDCGCSTQNQRLLDRIIDRITQYERANTSTQSAGGAQSPLIDAEATAYNEWFNGEQGTAYDGMWAFARAAWMARAASAPADSVTAPAGGMDDDVDAIALARYKVVPAHESMFHRFAVVAGDGKQQLYLGREVECENMARKFAGAFLDGAFYQANIAPTQPAQAADSVLEDAARLAKIIQAIRDYHFALDNREHGGVAMARAWNAICDVLDMDWVQGAESAARKQGANHD